MGALCWMRHHWHVWAAKKIIWKLVSFSRGLLRKLALISQYWTDPYHKNMLPCIWGCWPYWNNGKGLGRQNEDTSQQANVLPSPCVQVCLGFQPQELVSSSRSSLATPLESWVALCWLSNILVPRQSILNRRLSWEQSPLRRSMLLCCQLHISLFTLKMHAK